MVGICLGTWRWCLIAWVWGGGVGREPGEEKKKRQLPGPSLLILDIGEGAKKANLTSQRTRYTKIKAGLPAHLCLLPLALCQLIAAHRYRYSQPRNELLGSRNRGCPSHHQQRAKPEQLLDWHPVDSALTSLQTLPSEYPRQFSHDNDH